MEDPNTNARHTNYKKYQSKAKWIIYDSMKDNLMPIITPLKTVKECFDTMTNLYLKKAPSQKRELKNKIQNLNMEKYDILASFLTNISQVRD